MAHISNIKQFHKTDEVPRKSYFDNFLHKSNGLTDSGIIKCDFVHIGKIFRYLHLPLTYFNGKT
jgi:hypothetical protein